MICSFFRQVCVVDFLFSGVPQASAGVGHAFAFAVQALVVVLTQLRSPADGIGFGERADIEHDGSLFLLCDKDKDAPRAERVQYL